MLVIPFLSMAIVLANAKCDVSRNNHLQSLLISNGTGRKWLTLSVVFAQAG